MQNFRLILASHSPRRRVLLGEMGYVFETCSPDIDEEMEGRADETVRVLSQKKARAAAENYQDGIIIACDTLVSLYGRAFGKPANADDAKRMLQTLSGREHEVFTGVCLVNAKTGRHMEKVVRTGVSFRALGDAEIDEYIKSGEPMDKAGAYAIQGGAGAFVEKLDGSFENVMGFPVADVRKMLDEFTRGC